MAVREIDIQNELYEILIPAMGADVEDVYTFEEAGILTEEKGVILRFQNGQEFKITVTEEN